MIYCIVAGVNDIHERVHEHNMNINILVAEKGGPGPLGPIAGSATVPEGASVLALKCHAHISMA